MASQISDSSSALIHKLIGTTELCEQMMGYLSCTELCLVKRVCERLRNVIDDSLILQKRLFLKSYTRSIREARENYGDYVVIDEQISPHYATHTLIAFTKSNPKLNFETDIVTMSALPRKPMTTRSSP